MDQGMNNVMIAIDEGQCSNFAVEWALSNLKPIFNSGAGILLFTAVSTNYSSIVGGTHGAANLDLIAHIQENQEKTAIALLDKAKDLCVKHGVHVETAYEFGDPKDEICEAVEIYEVQLLVLGSHDIGAIQSCEEDMERERKKVMVAIDESKESYYTLLWAIDNIHEILASHQLVIFAAEPLPNYNNLFAASLSFAPLYSTVISAQDFAKSVQEIEKKVAIGLLEKAKSVCNSRGITAETILEEGDAKVAICDAVKEHKINMLVIAEQRIGRVKGLFSWSVSDYCIQYAKCPVLVVKKFE